MSSETARVHLSDDYYQGEQFSTAPQTWWSADDVYEVPVEQLAHWQAAQEAWTAAQQEMAALMDARHEQKLAEQAARKQRDDARRAEIRAGLYGKGTR